MSNYQTDFTNIDPKDIDKLFKAVEEFEYTPQMICKMSNHPDDDKLFIVLAQSNSDKSYCVWSANTFGNTASLFWGHYMLSFKQALKYVYDNIKDLNENTDRIWEN